MNNPGRTSAVGAKDGCAVVYRNAEAALSTSAEVKSFCHLRRGLYLWTVVWLQL